MYRLLVAETTEEEVMGTGLAGASSYMEGPKNVSMPRGQGYLNPALNISTISFCQDMAFSNSLSFLKIATGSFTNYVLESKDQLKRYVLP